MASLSQTERMQGWPHVVIVGGGFGGLNLAKALGGKRVRVTLVDRANHHLFQPLLYQVATAGLSPAEIAAPIRSILHDEDNVSVLLAEATGVDLDAKELHLDGSSSAPLAFDFLVVAVGAVTSYFGHDEWTRHAPGLKNLEDAIDIRRRVLLAFERAEREADPIRQRELLTFTVIGGGPTGVELAGAIVELSKFVLAKDFRTIDPTRTRVVLVEAGPRVLAGFDAKLSQKALDQLNDLGVEVLLGKRVTKIDEHGVELGDERIVSSTVIWGAGVRGNPFLTTLGAPLDSQGRVVVKDDCSIPEHPRVFVIGDAAAFVDEDGKTLPGLSPVAMQEGRAVAKSILATIDGRRRSRFRYVDKGSMATIGRSRAVAQAGLFRMSGLLAWLAWLVVHIWYLIGFRSRLVVLLTWAWSYVTYKRGARLITGSNAPSPLVGTAATRLENTSNTTRETSAVTGA